MNNTVVTILCSGVAMGVYIPGLALRYQLDNLHLDSEVVVLENLFVTEKRDKLNDTKKVFHKDFRIAQKAHQMAKDITPSLDETRVQELFGQWRSEGRYRFIVFSGFWLPILERYREYVKPHTLYADLVHMDSVVSPSWKSFKNAINENFEVIRLFNYEAQRLEHSLFTPQKALPRFADREDRLVIHGGGWGMGVFQTKIPELNEQGIGLNIMVYFKEEGFKPDARNRYFMVDPDWRPWHQDHLGRVMFPPFGEIYGETAEFFINRDEYHELFYVGARSKGIVSKPGGSTLVDSLASATPIIFLDALSDHEARNAELWTGLGFGIAYDDWAKSGFSFAVLEKLHQNLLAVSGKQDDYAASYVKKMNLIPDRQNQKIS